MSDCRKRSMSQGMHTAVLEKLNELYHDLYEHNGFCQLKMEIKFLKKGQKEVIINSGKEYRYVLNYASTAMDDR